MEAHHHRNTFLDTLSTLDVISATAKFQLSMVSEPHRVLDFCTDQCWSPNKKEEYQKMKILYGKNISSLWDMMNDIPLFTLLIWRSTWEYYAGQVYWVTIHCIGRHGVLGDMVYFRHCAKSLWSPFDIKCCMALRSFCLAQWPATRALSMIFSFLDFFQWLSSTDRCLILHMNIWSPIEHLEFGQPCQGHRLSHMCWPGFPWTVIIGIVRP